MTQGLRSMFNQLFTLIGGAIHAHEDGVCWVCRAPADSREHRFKKSDLDVAFGKGSYKGKGVFHFNLEEKFVPVQGAKADHLKYASSLCSDCNNRLSQPYDRAYEQLFKWVWDNEALVLRTRLIDFRAVYGPEWPVHVDRLSRYFAKSLGCRINDAKQPVPALLADAVRGGGFPRLLNIQFAVSEEWADVASSIRGLLWKSKLYCDPHSLGTWKFDFDEQSSWFTVSLTMNKPTEPSYGGEVTPKSAVAYMGSIWRMSPETRAEFYEKLRIESLPN